MEALGSNQKSWWSLSPLDIEFWPPQIPVNCPRYAVVSFSLIISKKNYMTFADLSSFQFFIINEFLFLTTSVVIKLIIREMSRISRRKIRLKTKRAILLRMIALKKCVTSSWKRVVGCLMQISAHNNRQNSDENHHQHHHHLESYSSPASSPRSVQGPASPCSNDDDASDLVSIKMCILGDPKIGKTSFLVSHI